MNSVRQSIHLCTRRFFGRGAPSVARLWLRRPDVSRSRPLGRFVARAAFSSSSILAVSHTPLTSGFEVIDPAEPFEEETLPGYDACMYYPAHIGDVFNDRYKVIAKLGYGVWAARDLTEPVDTGYVALKICITGPGAVKPANELATYERINSVAAASPLPGTKYIRKMLSTFEIQGPHGKRTCIVHEALGMSMSMVKEHIPGRTMTLETMKYFIRGLPHVLDFLNSEAGIIHTDIQPKNPLLPVNPPDAFKNLEQAERADPASRKILADRTIYSSRYPDQSVRGIPRLSDFGEARFADAESTGREDSMPDVYRAPEVTMQMGWDEKVDTWSVAMVAWDLVSPRTLFTARNPETKEPDDRYLVAELGALLGPPPPEFMRRSKVCSLFWDENGTWKNVVPLPSITLESLAADIQGDDNEKDSFLSFLRRILRWLPEERPRPEYLVADPWLMDGLGYTAEDMARLQEAARERETQVLKRRKRHVPK